MENPAQSPDRAKACCCRRCHQCLWLGKYKSFQNLRSRIEKSSSEMFSLDQMVRGGFYFACALALTVRQRSQIPDVVPPELQDPGFAPRPNSTAFSNIQHDHYARHADCEICDVRRDEDTCEVSEKCRPKDNCFTVGNGTPVDTHQLGPKQQLPNWQVGCMCNSLVNLNALLNPVFKDGLCILSYCHKQEMVCGDGCCHSRHGEGKICARTNILYDIERTPKELNMTGDAVLHNGTWYMPFHTCADEQQEDWRNSSRACTEEETRERLKDAPPFRDCSSSTWKLCCPGEKNCRRDCHNALWEAQQESAASEYLTMLGFIMLSESLCSRTFCRWTRSCIPDREEFMVRTLKDGIVALREYDIQVAIVIGCSGEGSLETPVSDAKAIEKALAGYDVVITLCEQFATPETVHLALQALIACCAGKTSPLIVFYFGGHGESTPAEFDLLYLHDRSTYDLQVAIDLFEKMDTPAGIKEIVEKVSQSPDLLRDSSSQLAKLVKAVQKNFAADIPGTVDNADCVFLLNACRTEAGHLVVRPQTVKRRPRWNSAHVAFMWAVGRNKMASDHGTSKSKPSPFAKALAERLPIRDSMSDCFHHVTTVMPREYAYQPRHQDLRNDASLAPRQKPSNPGVAEV